MEEERQEVEEIKDDGKVHFPVAGFIVIGVISVLMMICFIVLLVMGGQGGQ